MAISTSAIASEDLTLQTHLKAALEALWSSSNGSWEQLVSVLRSEIGKQVTTVLSIATVSITYTLLFISTLLI